MSGVHIRISSSSPQHPCELQRFSITLNRSSVRRTLASFLTSATRNFALELTFRAFAIEVALAVNRGEKSRPRTLYPLSANGVEWRPIPHETSRIFEFSV